MERTMTIKKFFAPSTTRLGRQQWFRNVWQRLTMVLMLVMLTTATGSEAWSMQIFVHRMLTDKTITLEVESTDSHEAIKEKIREKAEIDPANQWLVYGDTKLYDGKTLSDYNIQAESTIKLYETSVTNGFCGIETMNGGANVSWTYDESLHTLTIGGDGPMMYYNSVLNGDQSYSNGAPWKAFADEIEHVVISDGITYVGSNTFAHCPNISSVTLPTDQHLYEIGPGAFGDCTSLTSIDIPMSVNKINDGAFAGCSNLASVTLGYGDGATFTIGTEVFPATTTIIVPAVALQSYLQASSWCAYADKVISTGYCGKDNTETTDVDESHNVIWTLAKNTGDQIEGNEPLTLTISKNPEVTAEGADFSMADGWPFDDGDGGVDEVTTVLSITQAVIGEGVTNIGENAFQNCWNMATVSIPSTVTSIGTGAFLECKSLTSNITIPDGVTIINNSTFNGCEKLTTVVLPSGLTTIGASAFAGCYKLESIGVAGSTTNALPTSLTAIGTSAFSGSGLPAITLNEGLKTIDDGAFSSSKLTTINVPASVENIGEGAFTCFFLESISVADGNTHFTTDGKALIAHIDDNNTTLLTYARANTETTSYAVPNGVTRIGTDAFRQSRNLTEVTLPEGLKTIGDNTFYDCDAITDIAIPATVESIGEWCFGRCYKLATIRVFRGDANGITTIGVDAFTGDDTSVASSRRIYVPLSALNTYRTAVNWEKYYSGGAYWIFAGDETELFSSTATNAWMTWCSDKAYGKPVGCKAYTVSAVNDGEVTLTPVAGLLLPAYTPLLIKRDDTSAALTAIGGAAVTEPASGYDATTGLVTQSESNFNMLGNATDATITEGGFTEQPFYSLYNGKFYRYEGTQAIAAHRCILTVSPVYTAPVLTIGTETTSLSPVPSPSREGSSQGWYTLDGRKLNGKPTQKGIYVNGGRKVVVK